MSISADYEILLYIYAKHYNIVTINKIFPLLFADKRLLQKLRCSLIFHCNFYMKTHHHFIKSLFFVTDVRIYLDY